MRRECEGLTKAVACFCAALGVVAGFLAGVSFHTLLLEAPRTLYGAFVAGTSMVPVVVMVLYLPLIWRRVRRLTRVCEIPDGKLSGTVETEG